MSNVELEPEGNPALRPQVSIAIGIHTQEEATAHGIENPFRFSASSWFILCSCCLPTIVIPLGVLLPLHFVYKTDSKLSQGLLWAMIALLILGVVYLLCGLRKAIGLLLCNRGVDLPLSSSLIHDPEAPSIKTPPKKVYFIVNPYSGAKKGKQYGDMVVALWKEEFGLEATVLYTEYAGHARRLARGVDLTGYDGVVTCGGDGTFHEMVNGIMTRADNARPPIALIPLGTGNNIMLDLGTWDIKEAARRVGRGEITRVDVVRAEAAGSTVYCVNIAAAGMIANAGFTSERLRLFGRARYDVAGVFELFRNVSYSVDMTYTDATDKVVEEKGVKMLGLVAQQTQHMAMSLRMAPQAKVNDGLLHVIVSLEASRNVVAWQLAQLSLLHVEHPDLYNYARVLTVKQIKAQFPGPGVLNLDGENFRHDGSFTLICEHRAIPMFLPNDYKPISIKEAMAQRYT